MSADVAMGHALRHRDLRRVRQALARGADPQRPDAAGRCALHRAADTDARALVQCMLDAIAPHQRAAAVNAADVWGERPLHRAVVSDKREACARILLQAGAHPSALGALGRPPLLMAETIHAPNIARMLRAAGASNVVGEVCEAGRRALLDELFGLGGHTQLGDAKLPLRHGMAEGAFVWLAGLLQHVAETGAFGAAGAFRATLTRIAVAFADAGYRIGRDPDRLLATIQAGGTVVLPSGTPKHAVIYVWHQGALVACDRSRLLWAPWSKRRCRVLRTTAATLTSEDVRALQRSGVLHDSQARHQAARMDRRLFTGEQRREQRRWQRLAGGHAFAPQRVNNCVTAGAKMALYALMALMMPSAASHERTRLYKQLTTQLRATALAAYIAHPRAPDDDPRDTSLVARCEAKLAKRRVLSGAKTC